MASRKVPAETYPEIDRRQWHFVKTFSLDTVVNVLGVALVLGGPILYWGRAMESRVLSLEVKETEALKAEGRRERGEMDQRNTINSRLEKIENSLTATQIALERLNAQLQAPVVRSVR